MFFTAKTASNGIEFMVLPLDTDNDNDSMPDTWEDDNGLDSNSDDAQSDLDNDGLTNFEEYSANTDPNNSDTDGDGVPDGFDGSPHDDQLDLCIDLIRNGTSLEVFTTIQNALDDLTAVDNDTIQITAGDSEEDIVYAKETILTLSGGYYCNFPSDPSTSSLRSLVIENGTIVIGNIVIKP